MPLHEAIQLGEKLLVAVPLAFMFSAGAGAALGWLLNRRPHASSSR
jgi:hypothetical protein